MDFFDGGVSEEQLKTGLSVAAIAVSVALVAVAIAVVPHGIPVHWAEVLWSFSAIALVMAYIAGTYTLGTRHQRFTLRPMTVLAMVLACVFAITLLNVAADARSWLYEPLFGEVPVFVALIGNAAMRRISLVATVTGMAATMVILTPASAPSPWSGIVMYATVLVIMESMVGAVMTAVRGRNAARGTINTLMTVAAEVERLDDALATTLPLIEGVIPAFGAAVMVRSPGAEQPALLAAWVDRKGPEPDTDPGPGVAGGGPDDPGAPGARSTDPAPDGSARTDALAIWSAHLADADGDLELQQALAATANVITGRWWGLPIGYGPEGELLLVVERRPGHGYHTRFALEAADALAACFLRLTSRLAHLDRLRLESMTDPLTGLSNRRLLLGRLQLELTRGGRGSDPVTVAMIDLDHFKEVNDVFGHLVGDELLRMVASAVAARMRAQDLACRYGGDELCLVLPGTDADGARQLLEDVRQRVAAASATAPTGVPVTVSVGAAVWDGNEPPESLLARADAELLQAKRSGRDTVAVAGRCPAQVAGPTARPIPGGR